MEPKLIQVAPFMVSGISVRTSNHDEADPETARIGDLWTQFFSKGFAARIPHRSPDAPIFGVYSDYESDADGAYDLTAGVSVEAVPDGDLTTVKIHGGAYLVFEGRGPMPGVVVETWKKIWAYFAEMPKVRRIYTTDFETYRGPNVVLIHIAVEV